MYIQPISNSDISMRAKPMPKGSWKAFKDRVKQKVLDVIPEIEFKNPTEKIKKIDERLSRPAENRALMGATAVFMQPTIDSFNKKVDDDTRKVSICRTIAKIVVGTLVGIAVRGSVYKLIENMTNLSGKGKWARALLPDKYVDKLAEVPKFLQNYKSALSTSSAIGVMLFTNFAIDAPFTVKLTNSLVKNFVDNKPVNDSKEVKHE